MPDDAGNDAGDARMRRSAGAVLVAVTALLAFGPVVPAAHAAAAGDLSVQAAVRGTGLLRSGDALTLEMTVTNDTSASVSGATVRIGIDPDAPDSAASLDSRLADPVATGWLLKSVSVPTVPAGTSRTFSATVPGATVAQFAGPEVGARVLSTSLTRNGDQVAIDATAITWLKAGTPSRLAVAAVVPLTAPAGSTGLVPQADLAGLTGEGGAWRTILHALQQDPTATLALDPAVQASIRVLGAAAPPEATEFLAELAALPNPVIRLPYADADTTLERLAGAKGVITPFAVTAADAASGSAPSATPSPAPTSTPTRSSLLAWRYSSTAIAMPATGIASSSDLRFLADSGYSTTVLPGTNVSAFTATGPGARVGGRSVLVADTDASERMNEALSGTPESARATSELIATLFTDAKAARGTVLLTIDRASAASDGLGPLLRTLHEQQWLRGTALTGLPKQQSTPSVTVKSVSPAKSSVHQAAGLVAADADVRHLRVAMQDGGALADTRRLAVVGLLSSGWRGQTAWADDVTLEIKTLTGLVGDVRVDRSSPLNYIGGSASLPVTVVNDLPVAVRVTVHGEPDNGKFTVQGTRTITVPANTNAKALLPARSISNGSVEVDVWITTEHGWRIGAEQHVPITVNAGWETVGAIVFAAGFLLLFGTGVYRNLIRRRKAKT